MIEYFALVQTLGATDMLPLRCFRTCLIVGWALLLVVGLPVDPLAAQQFTVRHYTVDDGLPSGVVRAIEQGPRGSLWFATRSGVARYDGTTWSVFNLRHGFKAADQFGLAWDEDGTLWSVSTLAPFDLYRFDGSVWHAVPGPDLALPVAVGGDDAPVMSAFAVATLGGESTFMVGTDQGLFHHQAEAWRDWTVADGLPHSRIVGLVPVVDAVVVATETGLARFNGREFAAMGPATLPGPLSAVARDAGSGEREDRWWLAGPGWVGLWRVGGVLEPVALPSGIALQVPRAIHADGRGGVFVIHGERVEHVTSTPAASAEALPLSDLEVVVERPVSLFVDREQNLWIGGHDGVSKWVRRPFARLSARHGLLDDEVTAVAERADGAIILGHPGGLTRISPDTGTLVTTSFEGVTPDAQERVWDLTEDEAGTVWIAGGRNGLGQLGRNGVVQWQGLEAGLPGSVTAVVTSPEGTLWVGTEAGLRQRAGSGQFQAAGGGTEAMHVRALSRSPDGTLLVSTTDGLVALASDEGAEQGEGDPAGRDASAGRDVPRTRQWQCRGRAGCNSLFAALAMPNGGFWVGTSAGLFQTAADQSLTPTPEPIVDRPVYFLFRDPADQIWLGTDNGVLRWDGETLRAFTNRDGLAGRETNRSAWQVDRRGRIWVGTERGVSVLPTAPTDGKEAPPLILLDALLVASDPPRSLAQPVTLGYRKNDLTLRFRAVSMLDETRNRVVSMLEGFDEDWSEPHPADRVAEARYTNLPPGRYVFHAKAANADGVWSAPASSEAIVIGRPFWLATWFHLAAVVLLGVLAYSARRLVTHGRYARRLEQEVEAQVAEVLVEKERLAVTLRNIDDGVLTTDEHGEVIFLNPVAQELVGYRPGSAIGRPLREVLRLRQITGEREVFDPFELLEARDIEALEHPVTVELTPLEGASRLVEISGSPIVGSRGRVNGLVLAFRDVTERQRIDQELAKGRRLEALGLLAGGIAHDFNNLLTVMLGSLSMVDRGDTMVEHQKKLLRDAEAAVLRARDLTQQLLTFSRGGAPVRAAAAIGEVVRESASFVLSGANVRAEIELPDDLWVVDIDAGQISQVINNLLINATQAMPDGGVVRVTGSNVLGSTVRLPRDRYVMLSVIDEGVGIPVEHLDRIFDPYFSTKEEGRGLGLASAYSIAKRHDGLLSVSSAPGTGTHFQLYLPASSDTTAALKPAARAKEPRAGCILIMDDDDGVRAMMGAMVRKLGFEVTLTADGAAAVTAYQEALASDRPFDGVIMDLTVRGGMGGKEAIGHLLDADPAVRAIVASGYSNDPVMANHQAFGFLGRISKPFPPDELGRVLDEVLAGRVATGARAASLAPNELS